MSKLTTTARSISLAAAIGLFTLAACSDTDTPTNMTGSSGSSGQAQGGSSGSTSASGAGNTSAGTSSMAGSAGAAGSATAGMGGGGAGGAAGSGGGGAGGAGGGAGGSAGQSAYNPCPQNGDPCRIMPLGDSITDGAGSSHGGSYRLDLFRLSLMNQKKLSFVGSHQSGPDMVMNVPFPKSQEGHSGWTIDDGGGREGLYPEIQMWMTNTPPDIVTLMIGTNDVDIQLDLANAGMRLGLLLDRIIMYAPNALIVLAQMVPTTDDTENQRVQTYNGAMPALVKARADAGKHIIMVDMYGAFTKNANYKTEYMQDKLHPKDAGYVVMANTWYDAFGPLLPPAQ